MARNSQLPVGLCKFVLMYNGKKVVVVMPAYRAALTLERTYREIPFDLVDDVILVDVIAPTTRLRWPETWVFST